MDDRPVVVRDGSGSSSVATIGIIAVIVIAAIIAFFVWRGSATNNPNPSNQTTINNPAGGGTNGGTSGGTSGGSGGGSSGGSGTKP